MRAVRWSATTLMACPQDIRWYINMQSAPDEEFQKDIQNFTGLLSCEKNLCNCSAHLVAVKQGDRNAGTTSDNLVLNQDFFSLNEIRTATLRKSSNTTFDIVGKGDGCFNAVISEVTEYQFASANGVFQTARQRHEFDLYSKSLPIAGLTGPNANKTVDFIKDFWDLGMEALRALQLCSLHQKSEDANEENYAV